MIADDLEKFINKILNFELLTASEQIDFFVYYQTVLMGQNGAKGSDIKEYFLSLHLKPYSNIASYLTKYSKGKSSKFIRNNSGYLLQRTRRIEIEDLIGKVNPPSPTDNLFPFDLIRNTRGYIEKVAEQACICYDIGLYDACLVMARKMLETFIIETFERYSISDKIKGLDGNFFYLGDLINSLVNDNTWNLSRNAKQSLPNIKKIGDLSAHNRRFIAKKHDIDKIKDDLRIVIEELVHLIDYPNWKY